MAQQHGHNRGAVFDRLLDILDLLEGTRRGLTARQLAEKSEVNIRTVYRYLTVIACRRPLTSRRDGKESYFYIMRSE